MDKRKLRNQKYRSFLLCACLLLTVTACNGGGEANSEPAETEAPESNQPDASKQPESEPDESASPSENEPEQSADEGETASGSSILVAYFSLAGEQYEVGVIEKGNTEIVAEMIAEATGADTFKIESTEEYPTTYDGLLDVSRQEEDDPPEIAGTVDNMDDYDTIFLGYPIWWGEAPRIMSTFIESYDFSGKTLAAFCTSASSGFGNSDSALRSAASGAAWLDGRRFSAGADSDEVMEWASGLGIN